MLILGLALLLFSFPLAVALGTITVYFTILFRERGNQSVVPREQDGVIALGVLFTRFFGSVGTLSGLFIVILQIIELFGGTP